MLTRRPGFCVMPGWVIRRLDRGKFVRRAAEWKLLLHGNGWRLDDVVSADEILAAIDAVLPLLREAGLRE